MTSLIYLSSGRARFRLKRLTLPLCVHVEIQLHLICKLSERRALQRKKQERQDVLGHTIIMPKRSTAA